MSNQESIFNPDEYLVKTEITLSHEHMELLKAKAEEIGMGYVALLEIVISNYRPVTAQEVEYYRNSRE